MAKALAFGLLMTFVFISVAFAGDLQCNNSTEVIGKKRPYCPTDYCQDHEVSNANCQAAASDAADVCNCRIGYKKNCTTSACGRKRCECIRAENCPPFSCADPNEEYTACKKTCPNDSCEQAHFNGVCPYKILIVVTCNAGCVCKEGYSRYNGTCICTKKCPADSTS